MGGGGLTSATCQSWTLLPNKRTIQQQVINPFLRNQELLETLPHAGL